jgi:hypothetical protein
MASTTTEKKPVAKKPAAKKETTSNAKAVKKATAKKSPAKKTSNSTTSKISAAERYRMVETAAYFIAERNGFAGSSTDYWIAAEVQIKRMLAK